MRRRVACELLQHPAMTRREIEIEICGVLASGEVLSWQVFGEQDCFSVGRHPGCQWYVDQEDVAPVHFDLVAVAETLWLLPRATVHLDGVLLRQSCVLPDSAIIDFGAARMRVTRRSSQVSGLITPRQEEATRIGVVRQPRPVAPDEEPTRIGGGLPAPRPIGEEPTLLAAVAPAPGRRFGPLHAREELSQARTIVLPLAALPGPPRAPQQAPPPEPPAPGQAAELAELFSLPADLRRAAAPRGSRERRLVLGSALVAAAVALIILFSSHGRVSASQPSHSPPGTAPAPALRPRPPSIIPVQTGPAAVDLPAERVAAEHLIGGRLDLALEAYRALAAGAPDDRRYPAMVGLIDREITDRCRTQQQLTDPLCVGR
jgi:hypothetical protein